MKYLLVSFLIFFWGCNEVQQKKIVSRNALEAGLTEKVPEVGLGQKTNAPVSLVDQARRNNNYEHDIVYIGYLNNNYAFKEEKTNNIFVLNNKNLVLYKEGQPGLEPMFINNAGVVYKTKKDGKFYLDIVTALKTQTVSIPFATNHVVATESLQFVFYVEDGSDDTSALMQLDVDKQLQEKKADVAYYAEVIGDKIYYLQLTEEGYPRASIYSSPISNFNEKALVLDDVFLSSTHIFSGGKYILATKWLNGKKADIIYNYDVGKYAYIDNSFAKENYFAFAVDSLSIGFYHPEKRVFKYANIPESLPYNINTRASRNIK